MTARNGARILLWDEDDALQIFRRVSVSFPSVVRWRRPFISLRRVAAFFVYARSPGHVAAFWPSECRCLTCGIIRKI